jgi:hypothetical protein
MLLRPHAPLAIMPSAACSMVPHVGCEVGQDCFDIGEIKPAGDVLRGVVEERGHVDRERGEHLIQVIRVVIEVDADARLLSQRV